MQDNNIRAETQIKSDPRQGTIAKSFLQSYEWEKLQEAIGRKNWRIEGHLVIQHDLPQGFNYLYAPHLPHLTDQFLHQARMVALQEKSLFLKIDPHGKTEEWELDIMGWQFSDFLQPQKTIILDLTKTEDELLNEMHPKTRYNVRLAEKHGVNVFKCKTHDIKEHLDMFWDLLTETAGRDVFHLHVKHYYQKLLTLQGQNFSNRLVVAEHRGKALAAAIINYYHDTATYLHGASSSINREVMAPHLLHWRIIQDAQKNGFKKYDLWGVDEEKWPGVTRFKLGFGGQIVEHSKSIDIIFRPMWYRAYKILRKIV